MISLPALAHPGGLDVNGCHNEKATGSYHCHRAKESQSPPAATTMAPATTQPATLAGTASVIDGDTIEMRGQRIRLHGIDAPESRQECRAEGKSWRCGQRAALALSDKIGRRPVTCHERDKDRYGRTVAVCTLSGEDVNRWLVSEGWALAYRQYSKDYVADELAAQKARKGIWVGTFEVPWDWRKAQRK